MLNALAVLRFLTSSYPAPAGPLAKSGLDGSRAAWVLEKKCERNRRERKVITAVSGIPRHGAGPAAAMCSM
jgi:hypothetical protein